MSLKQFFFLSVPRPRCIGVSTVNNMLQWIWFFKGGFTDQKTMQPMRKPIKQHNNNNKKIKKKIICSGRRQVVSTNNRFVQNFSFKLSTEHQTLAFVSASKLFNRTIKQRSRCGGGGSRQYWPLIFVSYNIE